MKWWWLVCVLEVMGSNTYEYRKSFPNKCVLPSVLVFSRETEAARQIHLLLPSPSYHISLLSAAAGFNPELACLFQLYIIVLFGTGISCFIVLANSSTFVIWIEFWIPACNLLASKCLLVHFSSLSFFSHLHPDCSSQACFPW